MSKQLILLLLLTSSICLSPCQAAPSLLCIPKINELANPNEVAVVTDNKKRDQTSTRRIRVYYVNGHREWEAKAVVNDDQVKAIIFRGNQDRLFVKSRINGYGFGSGIDFRGMPWEFRGFLEPKQLK
jgi:uncharacterized protein YnzC (UPF0291/DUF896 family)